MMKIQQVLIKSDTVWKVDENKKIFTISLWGALNPEKARIAGTYKATDIETVTEEVWELARQEIQKRYDLNLAGVSNAGEPTTKENFNSMMEAVQFLEHELDVSDISADESFLRLFRVTKGYLDDIWKETKENAEHKDIGSWVKYSGPGSPCSKLWDGGGYLFSTIFDSTLSSRFKIEFVEDPRSKSGSVPKKNHKLSVEEDHSILRLRDAWVRMNNSTGEISWFNDGYEFDHCGWTHVGQLPFKPKKKQKCHLVPVSCHSFAQIVEGVGINIGHLLFANLNGLEITDYNLSSKAYGTLSANDCRNASSYQFHDNVIYWIRDYDLLGKSATAPVVKIYDGRVSSFTISNSGVLFVYNPDRDLVEHAAGVTQKLLDNTILNWVPLKWQGEVKGISAEGDAVAIYNEEKLKLYPVQKMEHHDHEHNSCTTCAKIAEERANLRRAVEEQARRERIEEEKWRHFDIPSGRSRSDYNLIEGPNSKLYLERKDFQGRDIFIVYPRECRPAPFSLWRYLN
ncbi:hypothetical protein TWF718_003568 [Orbilia javanica]|uniref:Uncharacterized protein n=1 Tax=Orbilia javanica TaxID=47235 RepID=A0AAN8RIX3_9PEZI